MRSVTTPDLFIGTLYLHVHVPVVYVGEIGSISNVLTLEERRKMTLAQKESWRAKQADLTDKRKDFHGVVTYTFDGVFAWQMYGSAEAVDESGSNYTEYLMRCQWGTTFENMQPWIAAHRYREFDQLDQALKRKFPRLEANMPKLPKKDLFRSLSSDVVAERRAVLEEYMSKIVSSMPSLLRSELMNDFLDITNRISGIRLMLLRESNKRVEMTASGGAEGDASSTGKVPEWWDDPVLPDAESNPQEVSVPMLVQVPMPVPMPMPEWWDDPVLPDAESKAPPYAREAGRAAEEEEEYCDDPWMPEEGYDDPVMPEAEK